jgi:hypothetical protein
MLAQLIGQAAGLAILAAMTPVAVVAGAAYLSSANPRRTLLIYLAGAATMTVIAAIVILLAVHAGGLNHARQSQPRYGLRLGLGVIALAASLIIAPRKPKPPKPDKKPGLITRMMNHPSPAATFAVGMLIFAPSVAFIAAVQVIATSRASDAGVALALAVVIVIDLLLVWLPLALHLVAPDATTRRVKAVNAWLRAHRHVVTVTVLAVVGVLLVGNGIYGLTT